MIVVRFWGVRGSIPTPGTSTVKYGGNTSCVEVRVKPDGVDDEEIIIIDAGSGIRLLGDHLLGEMPVTASILFSHVHWDHIQGFPFFRPGFIKGNVFQLFGLKYRQESGYVSSIIASTLRGQQEFPNFPVKLDAMGSEMHFKDIEVDETFTLRYSRISNTHLVHPGGSVAFRIEELASGKSIVYCSDTEHINDLDKNISRLCNKTDLLIYDSQYSVKEYPNHIGWGHSTWEEGVRYATELDIPRLVLFHHDPQHADRFLEQEILTPALHRNPHIQTMLAQEGMVLTI